MSKIKYRYNPETLSYSKIETSLGEKLLKLVFTKFTPILIFTILFFFAFSYFIDSPRERNLKRINAELKLKCRLLNKSFMETALTLEDLRKRDDTYREIFETKPISKEMRKAGFGGINRYKRFEGYESSDIVKQLAQRMDILTKQMVVQSRSYDEIIELVKNKEKMLACIPAIRPISNTDLTRFGSAFGLRMHPILNYRRMHYGVDLVAPRGTKVYAAGDGVIERAQFSQNGFGNNVIVNHGYSYKTVYAHLSKVLVKLGDKVKRGDVIGLVGSTGLSTCNHLHYEVRKDNIPVNPINYYNTDLTDEEYERMIQMSSSANTHVFPNEMK